MDKKIVAIILIIIAVVIGGAYYTSHSDDNIMTIGYLPSDHDAALFVANSQGEFAKHGVHIKLVQFNNGGDLMTAMASGDVEVGYVGITPVLSSIEKGVPVKYISPINEPNWSWGNSGYQSQEGCFYGSEEIYGVYRAFAKEMILSEVCSTPQ